MLCSRPYLGKTDEAPEFYERPESELEEALRIEHEQKQTIEDYIYWFGDDTDHGNERLRQSIQQQ